VKLGKEKGENRKEAGEPMEKKNGRKRRQRHLHILGRLYALVNHKFIIKVTDETRFQVLWLSICDGSSMR